MRVLAPITAFAICLPLLAGCIVSAPLHSRDRTAQVFVEGPYWSGLSLRASANEVVLLELQGRRRVSVSSVRVMRDSTHYARRGDDRLVVVDTREVDAVEVQERPSGVGVYTGPLALLGGIGVVALSGRLGENVVGAGLYAIGGVMLAGSGAVSAMRQAEKEKTTRYVVHGRGRR